MSCKLIAKYLFIFLSCCIGVVCFAGPGPSDSNSCHQRWFKSGANFEAGSPCKLSLAKRRKSFCRFTFICDGKKYYLSCGPGSAPAKADDDKYECKKIDI